MIEKERLFLSTLAVDAAAQARAYGVGLEIAEYCTAYNMDLHFAETDAAVRQKLEGIGQCVLHAPFNELFPCAIDPKARELAEYRYLQAMELAEGYGAQKIVIHSGYAPNFYYDCWFEEQTALFWTAFLKKHPDRLLICLENVLETAPEPLLHVLQRVEDERLRICFDVGHANAYSDRSVEEWLERFAPYIAHFHLHNNFAAADTHNGLADGTIDMKKLLEKAAGLCPKATFTVETTNAERDLRWLRQRGFLEE